MKPYQLIGWTLLNTTAVTAITSTRINHGLRPSGTIVPSINYYELGTATRQHGMEQVVYSINCRASTPGVSRDLARLVLNVFIGSNGDGTYGENNGFEVTRASLEVDGGLIPEPEDGIYNSPVDVRIVYPVSTVS
jgi:hypothetical protein